MSDEEERRKAQRDGDDLYLKVFVNIVRATLHEALAEGVLPSPDDVRNLKDAIWGPEDPINKRRAGGMAADIRTIKARQRSQLVLQAVLTMIASIVPVIVVYVQVTQ